MSRQLEVLISPKGEVKIEGQGFTGADCELATREYESAMGGVVNEQKTAEYYKAAEAKQEA